MIEQLVSKVFADRNRTHLEHWAARGVGSYAKHIALGEFYDTIIDTMDATIEMYQGVFGLIDSTAVTFDVVEGDIIAVLENTADWLELNRDKICKRNTAVGNQLDTLLGDYYTTIYKLTNLQ